jgi:hypothetical protein
MKRVQIIIIAAVGAAAILTALGVGFYIGEVRQKKEAAEKPQQVGGESLIPGRVGRDRFSNLSEEERARIVEGRKQRAERWANMSDEEKEKFRQQLRRRFNVRGGEERRLPALSEEERANLRQRWANMSMQEREEFRAKMRERFGAAQREPNAVQSEPNIVGQEPNAVGQEKK